MGDAKVNKHGKKRSAMLWENASFPRRTATDPSTKEFIPGFIYIIFMLHFFPSGQHVKTILPDTSLTEQKLSLFHIFIESPFIICHKSLFYTKALT